MYILEYELVNGNKNQIKPQMNRDAGLDIPLPTFNTEFIKLFYEINDKFNGVTKDTAEFWGEVGEENKNKLALKIKRGTKVYIPLGIKIKTIDDEHNRFYLRLTHRSSIPSKFDLLAIEGVIDEQYRGEIIAGFISIKGNEDEYIKLESGQCLNQLIIHKIGEVPGYEVKQVKSVGDTSRGSGGFGSTGK